MREIAVILAGGLSKRMGRDKATLPYGKKENLPDSTLTMLEQAVKKYKKEFEKVYVSVNEAGRFCTYGAGELVDIRPGEGPLAGLETAFVRTGAEIVFLTATDLPYGSPELARRLVENCKGHQACVLSKQEPLFAAYRRDCLAPVREALDQGKKSCVRLLQSKLDTLVLDIKNLDLDHMLFNMNEPADYEKVLSEAKFYRK